MRSKGNLDYGIDAVIGDVSQIGGTSDFIRRYYFFSGDHNPPGGPGQRVIVAQVSQDLSVAKRVTALDMDKGYIRMSGWHQSHRLSSIGIVYNFNVWVVHRDIRAQQRFGWHKRQSHRSSHKSQTGCEI